MTLNRKTISLLDIAYCYIPSVIFLLSWCQWYIGVPAVLMLSYALYFLLHKDYWNEIGEEEIKISYLSLAITLLISLIICILIGYGGFFANNYDYAKHSAVIQDLTNYSWPVLYTAYRPAMLTYYIGQYLPAALVGKILGSAIAAEISMGVFCWLGVYLLYLNLVCITNANSLKKQLSVLLLFFLFAGLLLPLQTLFKVVLPRNLHDFLSPHWFTVANWQLQYRFTLTALKWVYPQYIIPCLCACLLLYKQNSALGWAFIVLPCFICGTWGFLCLVFICIILLVVSVVRKQTSLSDVFSIPNLFSVLVGTIFLLYFLGNIGVDKPDYCYLSIMRHPLFYLLVYIPFSVAMYGIYAALIYPEYKRNVMYWAVISFLLTISIFRMGLFNDIVLCSTMPALFILFCLIAKMLFSMTESKHTRYRKIAIYICLVLSLYSPIADFCDCFPLSYAKFPKRTLLHYTDFNQELLDESLRYNYYAYEYENTIFYKYIAKK